jgi:hypothetical protein
MGLDVYGACKLRFSTSDKKNRRELFWTYIDPSGEWYASHCSDLPEGYYHETEASQRHLFRVGSYHTYNEWRNELSLMALGVPADVVWASPETYALRPFYYLINFLDSDGVIGQTVCKLLAQQFGDFQQVAARCELYDEFRKAFELGADGGLVEFC